MTKEMTKEQIYKISNIFNNDIVELLLQQKIYYSYILETQINNILDKHPNIKMFHICNYDKFSQITNNSLCDTMAGFFGKYNITSLREQKKANVKLLETTRIMKTTYNYKNKPYDIIIKPVFYFINNYTDKQDETIYPFLQENEKLINILSTSSQKKEYLTFIYKGIICDADINNKLSLIIKPKKDKYKNKKLKKKLKKIQEKTNKKVKISLDDIINDSSLTPQGVKVGHIFSKENLYRSDDEIINDSSLTPQGVKVGHTFSKENLYRSDDEIKDDEIKQDDIINDSSDDEIIKDNNHKEDKIIFNYYIEDKDKIKNMIDNLISINDNFNNNFIDMKLKIKKGLHYDNFKRLHFTAYFFNETTKKPTYHFYIKDDIIINITVINNIL